jgi:hypothetical protein
VRHWDSTSKSQHGTSEKKPLFPSIEIHLASSKSGWWCNLSILKNHGVRHWVSDDITYMKWKKKLMFETTNQKFS